MTTIEMNYEVFVYDLMKFFSKVNGVNDKRNKSFTRGGRIADSTYKVWAALYELDRELRREAPKLSRDKKFAEQMMKPEKEGNPTYFIKAKITKHALSNPKISIDEMNEKEAMKRFLP